MSADPIRQAHDKLMKQASEQGKLLEAGFIALQAVALQSASPQALETARLIYMAGAQHLIEFIYPPEVAAAPPAPQTTKGDAA